MIKNKILCVVMILAAASSKVTFADTGNILFKGSFYEKACVSSVTARDVKVMCDSNLSSDESNRRAWNNNNDKFTLSETMISENAKLVVMTYK